MKRIFKEKLRGLGVSIIYLFGSKSRGKGSPLSDVDVGVVFSAPPLGDTRAVYQGLYDIFSEMYPSSRIDIVLLQQAPLALQHSAIREGKVLFQEDPIFTAVYENRIIIQYLDFRPVLDYFDSIAARRYAQT